MTLKTAAMPHASDSWLSRTLNAADAAGDMHDEIAARALDAARLVAERDARRADGIQVMLRAKAHDGRVEEPVTAHDAAVAYSIADLLHTVAGAVVSVKAVTSAPTTRTLSPKVEGGIAESAKVAAVGDLDPPGNVLSTQGETA